MSLGYESIRVDCVSTLKPDEYPTIICMIIKV